jgi:hypothetical protein
MPLRRPYLVSHRSPRLRAWRLLGVVLMCTHSHRTVVDFLAKRRVEQAIATCLATPRATDFEGVPCAIAAPRRGLFRRRVGARPEDVGARPRNVYGDAVWWFLFADIFVHLVTGRRRRDGTLEPLNHDYARSWLFFFDVALMAPRLYARALRFAAPSLRRLAGLDRPWHFVYHRVVVHRAVRERALRILRFAFQKRRCIRLALAELGLAVDATREIAELVEIGGQTREIFRGPSARTRKIEGVDVAPRKLEF